jgi:Anti-sigma factor NepR
MSRTEEGKEPERLERLAARARQRVLGRGLREMYEKSLAKPMADDLLDLLRKIDRSGGGKAER